METAIVIDNTSKQMGLKFKKRYDHAESDVTLKVKGLLNTVTSDINGEGTIYKFVRLGQLTAYSPGQVYRPDTRLRLGIGARALSASDDILFSVSAKKKVSINKSIDVIRGREVINSYTQVVAKTHYDYNMKTDKFGGEALIAASHAIFRFSDDQDIRVSVGLRSALTPKGVDKLEPFLKVQENCWAVHSNLKGDWRITYDL